MMDILELLITSSHHVILHDKYLNPVGFGSGCIVFYKNRYFLLSVAHVTDYKEVSVMIETNRPQSEKGTPLYCVGSLCYFDLHKINPKNVNLITSAQDLLKDFDETLDITFCEFKNDVELFQPEQKYRDRIVPAGVKTFLNLEEAGKPDKEHLYGLAGRIKQDFKNGVLYSTPTLKLDLKYKATIGNYHIFTVPEIIADKSNYEGCSGAPILDDEGKLVGLAAEVREGSKILRAFSIDVCKELLDTAMQTNLV